MPDLNDLLSAASAGVVVGAPPGADAAVAVARTRRRRHAGAAALALVALLASSAAVIPRLGGGAEADSAVSIAAPSTFAPLAPDEYLANVVKTDLSPSGTSLRATYSGTACFQAGTRWDVLQSEDQVRARLVLTSVRSHPCPSGAAGTMDTSAPDFESPIRDRRLVLETSTGQLVVREGSEDPFPALPNKGRLALLPTFSVSGRVLTAEYTAGACETPAAFDVRESATEVRVRLTVQGTPPNGADCPANGLAGKATTELSTPLGTRKLIRIGDDGAVDVTP